MSETLRKKSHKEWRKEAKKQRRKRCRQKLAEERDKRLADEESLQLQNPVYQTKLANERALEILRLQTEEHLREIANEKWLQCEQDAQEQFKIKQLSLDKIRKAKEDARQKIKDEFDKQIQKAKEAKERRKREADELEQKHNQFLEQIDNYINRNGPIPEDFEKSFDTNPGVGPCYFYAKTSACRFGDHCNRNHCRPNVSKLLIISNFYHHFCLDQFRRTEYGDASLEFDHEDLQKDFVDFFHDVLPELENFGAVEMFRVCYNGVKHLRGKVFVEYKSQRDALKAYRILHGRFYASRQLSIEFGVVPSWKAAICGLAARGTCPKASGCNYLHVFKNPNNRFPLLEKIWSVRGDSRLIPNLIKSNEFINLSERKSTIGWNDEDENTVGGKKNHWRWSESPETDIPVITEQNKPNNESVRTSMRRSSFRNIFQRNSRSRSPTRRSRLSRSSSRDGSHSSKSTSCFAMSSHRSKSPKMLSSCKLVIEKNDHLRKSSSVSKCDKSRRRSKSRSRKRGKSDKHERRKRSRSRNSNKDGIKQYGKRKKEK